MFSSQNATVLYVEDEFFIRELVSEALEDAGFHVVAAADGAAACDSLDESVEPFNVIITDVNLGRGLDGWEVARRARSTDGAMPVIYTTGAHGHERGSKGVTNSVMLAKPFAMAQLVGVVSFMLRQAGRC